MRVTVAAGDFGDGDYAIKRYAESAARRVADVISVVMDIDVTGGFANARPLAKALDRNAVKERGAALVFPLQA
jgi:hypothetical protein